MAPPRRHRIRLPQPKKIGPSLNPAVHLDPLLLLIPVVIAIFGVIMVYSSSKSRLASQGVDPQFYLKRQALFVVVGVGVMVVMTLVDYRVLRDRPALLYAIVLLGLGLVLTPLGAQKRGIQAWYEIGTFQLQPSEFAKLGVVLVLAAYCHEHKGELDAWRLGIALGLAATPIFILYLQPDLGTSIVLTVMVFFLLLVAGASPKHLFVIALLGISSFFTVVQADLLADYQVARLTTFVDQGQPKDAQERAAAYNLEQSKIAIGAGGIDGLGYGNGTQTNLSLVPEQHTDFIFTAVAEQFGFRGGAVLLGLFTVLCFRIWRAARVAADLFGTLICVGVMAMIAFQVFQNVGMTMGIMPITGIPLPWMSYGGSSVIVSFASIGIVVNIASRRFAHLSSSR
jgi:rod shape determining protein RodA